MYSDEISVSSTTGPTSAPAGRCGFRRASHAAGRRTAPAACGLGQPSPAARADAAHAGHSAWPAGSPGRRPRPGQLHFQRDVVARAWRRASRRVLPAPFLAPRVRLRQALVLGFQPGRHVARDEYRDARADVLFEQPHDEAQPPPGKSASVSSTPARAISASSSACTASYTVRRAATESCGSPCRRASSGEQHGRLGLGLEQRGRVQPPGRDAGSHRVAAVLSARAPSLDPILVAHRNAMG